MRTAGRFRPFFRVRFQRRSNGAELNICLPPWVVKRLRETVHEWVLKSMVFERIFIVLIQAKKQSLTKCVRLVNILNYWEFNHYFFFQAEDGIRDDLVTRVQTCALPICLAPGQGRMISRRDLNGVVERMDQTWRSEERRVGKECRSRWSPYHYKKKKTYNAKSQYSFRYKNPSPLLNPRSE